MDSWLVRLTPKRSGFVHWSGTLCCVLGQDTFSNQEYKWVPANCRGNLTNWGEVTCVASRGSRNTPCYLICYKNWDKLQQL